MQKITKYKIVRNIGLATVTAGLFAATFNVEFPEYHDYSPSEQAYVNELNDIKKGEINFVNQDLYNLLCAKLGCTELTHERLSKVSVLVINQELNNQDFSDLKYLPNLYKLYISNNNVNLDDLYYNSDLKDLTITDGNISNVSSLPNKIERIDFNRITVTDGIIITPNNLKRITLDQINANYFYLKNPSILEKLHINGNMFIDLNMISNCTNLKDLSILKCPNVANGHVLKDLNLTSLTLDDYSTIWLDTNTVNNINFESKGGDIKDEVVILDNIIKDLNLEGLSNDQKRTAIINFVIEKLSYDETIKNDKSGNFIRFYTNLPIYYAVRFSDSISINYSCLLQALANRAGLVNYQVINNSEDTFNFINTAYVNPLQYDLTNSNNYSYFTNANLPTYKKPLSEVPNIEIGYIDKYDHMKITFNDKDLKYKLGAGFLAIFLINLAYAITASKYDIDPLDQAIEEEKMYEKAQKLREQQPVFKEAKDLRKQKPIFTKPNKAKDLRQQKPIFENITAARKQPQQKPEKKTPLKKTLKRSEPIRRRTINLENRV